MNLTGILGTTGSKGKKTSQALTALMAISGLLTHTQAQAWGHAGHQIIGEVGSELATQNSNLWSGNVSAMGMLTNVPDANWKMGPNANREKPNHWFQPDSYFSSVDQFKLFPHLYADAVAKYSEAKITENGTAPWRIQQMFNLAVEALKKQDYALALEMAGTMSHYVGDLSQPLHVTKDFDGQESHDLGIHKFFETDNLGSVSFASLKQDVTTRAQALLNDPTFIQHASDSLLDLAFNEVDRAYAFKDQVIDNDVKLGRKGAGAAAQLELARSRLADGAATLAIVLNRISAEAKATEAPADVSVRVPTWVAPNF